MEQGLIKKNKILGCFLLLTIFFTQAGCSNASDSGAPKEQEVLNPNSSNDITTPPEGLMYPEYVYNLFQNEQVKISPVVNGTVTYCTFYPSFPIGLNLNSNCTISGSPIFAQDSMSYTIMASNSYGSTQTVISLRVSSAKATMVFGQGGSFFTAIPNNGGISENSLSGPLAMDIDSLGNIYVAEYYNNRVLYYPAGSTTATRVYGQLGSFTTNTVNTGGISSMSFSGPSGIAIESNSAIYVADSGNNRVLYFTNVSTFASRVYGQGGNFTTGTANNGGVSADSLYIPFGLAVDSSGGLYIEDTSNNRILYYPSGSTTATRVYGQGGSFTTAIANNGGISADSLFNPRGLSLDSLGGLYVADTYNHRVLYYPAGSTTATRVYGQGGSFTTAIANNGGISADSLYYPFNIECDSSGGIYIADGYNNRVLYYPAGSTTATRVYGQMGSFKTNLAYTVSENSFYIPYDIGIDPMGRIYIVDYGRNRILMY